MRKNNQGVTLVELLVGIAIGSLVTIAATTVILLGLRLNRQSMDTAGKQNTARVLLSSLESLATDGTISGFSVAQDGWQIYGKEGTAGVLYSYDAEKQTVFTGGTTLTDDQVIDNNGTPVMENVIDSHLEFNNGLLTISLETEDGEMVSSVYCRIMDNISGSNEKNDNADVEIDGAKGEAEGDLAGNATESTTEPMSEKEKVGRLTFVTILLDEYSEEPMNIGQILRGDHTGKFYSQWYITDGLTKPDRWAQNGWNEFTPWCACYVSWAISRVGSAITPDVNANGVEYLPSYAGVDSFLTYFYTKKDSEGNKSYWITADGWLPVEDRGKSTIYPGDIIFLDWVEDDVRNPQHVGVVLYTDEEDGKTYVYTIEGNVAASSTERYGTVGLRKYEINDKRILGYGVLDWQKGSISDSANPGNNP